MNKKLIIGFCCFFTLTSSIAQEIDDDLNNKSIKNEARYISLIDAIEEGLRKNYQQNIRDYNFEINNIELKDSYQNFWLPTVNLNLDVQPHTLGKVYKSKGNPGSNDSGPIGSFGVEIEDYTLFNWGRDYLNYVNEQAEYKRRNEAITEEKRELRFNIISSYFNLSNQNQYVTFAKKRLRHASFIYKLAKEKINLKKIRSSEFYQAKALFLDAHKNYHETVKNQLTAEEEFATLISDSSEAGYRTSQFLKYEPLLLKEAQARKYIQKRNPFLKQAKHENQIAKRTYKKQLKDNMPLPKISLRVAAYQHSFSKSGSKDELINASGNRDVELIASLNMKWKILGKGGLFNSRSNRKAFLESQISQIRLRETKRAVDVNTSQLFEKVSLLEKKIKALIAGEKNILKTFNTTLDDYISGRVKTNTIKNILDDYISTQQDLINSKKEHLDLKLELALSMGKDDLPGQRFERLGVKQ